MYHTYNLSLFPSNSQPPSLLTISINCLSLSLSVALSFSLSISTSPSLPFSLPLSLHPLPPLPALYVRVKNRPVRMPPGYQAELVVQLQWVDGEPPQQITSLDINSAYGL